MNEEIITADKGKEKVIDSINKRIGVRIMKRRNRMNPKMSQQQVGEIAGVSHSQIARYERGDQHIPGARLVLIAEALGTTVSYFVGIEELIEEKNSLSSEEKETISHLLEHFRDIDLPEVRDAIFDHVERMSKISFNYIKKEQQKTEYCGNEA